MESLANRMRPKCFAEVIGQQVAVSILQRQVATKSWKNAYLFCGSHGCGKTTVARIMANDINNGDGQPIELDAASNNGIDSIRELIQDAQQCSLDSDYKVYIIDEAHQLTRMAWDAMLKLIEEPPSDSIFIFCTTVPEKIPRTIMSRVQRFDFNKVDADLISDRLQFIMNEYFAECTFEPAAMDRIAFISNGHVRDAVAMLDKCISSSSNITLECVEKLFGLTSVESILDLERCFVEKDFQTAIHIVDTMISNNINPVNLYNSLYSYTIDCAIYSATLNIHNTEIPFDFKDKVIVNEKYKSIVKLFTNYLNIVSNETAISLIKTIILEVCS